MKKIRILALVLAVLMLPLSVLIGCNRHEDDETKDPDTCSHKWGKWETLVERDCTHEQVRKRTCRLCNTSETETKPAWGHSLGTWVSDNNASCTADGTKSKVCDICGYKETTEDVGSALGHTFLESGYRVSEDDEYIEIATCIKCEKATDKRLLGLEIDFEGDKSHLSYTKLEDYYVEGAGSVESKTETVGEGEDAKSNTYLTIMRTDKMFAGNSAFGLTLYPRAAMLKGTSASNSPFYVVEFDVRISKDNTKDLVLLSGTKKGATENFIKYNSEDGTLVTAAGAIYTLKEADYDRWLNIAVVLNDGTKEYTVYVDGYQLVYANGNDVATKISYANEDGYFLGYDLENLKIGLAEGAGVASSFDIDNIYHYIGTQPKNYKGSADPEYNIYVTNNGDKIVYKKLDSECTHTWGTTKTVAHTCVTTGYSIHTCTKCGGQEIFDVSTDALKNHNFVQSGVTEATCTDAKFISYQCTICGCKDGKSEGSSLGHEIDRSAATTKVIAPTCVDEGYTTGKCIRCGIDYEVDPVAALGHEIDYDNAESYTVVAPTCLNEGYTKGHCKRCEVSDYVTDTKAALGHKLDKKAEDYVKVEADCVTDGYEESTCGREGCSVKYKTNEVKAYGHSVVSKIVTEGGVSKVVSSCSRCETVVGEREVSTKVPDYKELRALIGESNMLGNSLYHFDDGSLSTIGDDTKISDSVEGFVPRYAKFTVKKDSHKAGNSYMEMVYSPAKKQGSDGVHAYFEFGLVSDGVTNGKDITVEMSFRIPDGKSEVAPMNVTLMDRSKKAYTGNHDVGFFSFDKTGSVTLASGLKIAQLKQGEWTRLAFVFHASECTFDVYVDGVMIENNVRIERKMEIDEFFPTGVRINTYDQSTTAPTRYLDIDEVYAYYSSIPAYVTGVKLNEKSGLSGTLDANKNSTDDNGAYLTQYVFCEAGISQICGGLVSKKNTRFYIDSANGNALHYIKNSNVANIPGFMDDSKSDSYIDVNIGYGDLKISDDTTIQGVKHQYKNIVFETDLVINEGTGNFNIITGRKVDSGTNKELTFLQYSDGKIVSNGDVIISDVKKGENYTVAVVMREHDYNYDIYINGYLMRERVAYPSSYSLGGDVSSALFRMFYTTGDMDVLISNLRIYGGSDVPELNYGLAEIVKVSGKLTTNVVSFTEDYDYSVHYPTDKRANGDYIYDSKNSTLEIVSGLNKPINDFNLGMIKVDKDGNTGDDADDASAVWALKTGDWKSNCTTANGELGGLMFYPKNVTMTADGYYDLTGYESITFRYYVAESAGYKFLITLNCPRVNNANCYFTHYVTIEADDTGWHELTVELSKFGKNNAAAWDKITNITFNFSGWANAGLGATGGTAGKLGDGTTLYIAGIDLNSKGTDIELGFYGKNTCCKDGNHSLGEVNTVEATAHVNKYEYRKCVKPGCEYIELKEYEGTATGHVPTGEKIAATSKDATCTSDGIAYYEVDCEVCGKITVGEKIYKTGHKWVKSTDETLHKAPTCTEDGYDTYVCSGCEATAKVTIAASGHKKDENVDTITVNPSCTEGGYKQDHCSVCQQDYKYDEVGALDHDKVVDTVINEGSCTEDRVIAYKCTRCEWTETVTTTAKGHDYKDWTTVTPAGCGDGLEKRECKNCEHYETRSIPGTGKHNYNKISETIPTCGKDGSRLYRCTLCGHEKTDKIDATGDHDYDESNLKKVEPTANSEGYDYYECKVCHDHKIVKTYPAVFEGTQDLVFDISGDIAIVGKYTGTETEIVIPGTYAGKPVVVSKKAFSGNTNITSVTLGKGATLAQNAFADCTALKTVVLGSDMTEIGVGVFKGCTALEAITIPASVTKIDMQAFMDCTSLKTVTLLGTPTAIEANAFGGCTALETVNYVGQKAIQAGEAYVALGNDKFFGATWKCDYKTNS